MVKMANFKAIMRLFGKFDQARNDGVFGRLYRWLFSQLQVGRLTLDVDSTVMTRYGQQQGAAKGYNPTKPGRHSPHPLMAFVSDVRMVANCRLRPGNTGSANNVVAFPETTLEHLGNKPVGLLRADSGFCEANFLHEIERRGLNYVIALKLNQPLLYLLRTKPFETFAMPHSSPIQHCLMLRCGVVAAVDRTARTASKN